MTKHELLWNGNAVAGRTVNSLQNLRLEVYGMGYKPPMTDDYVSLRYTEGNDDNVIIVEGPSTSGELVNITMDMTASQEAEALAYILAYVIPVEYDETYNVELAGKILSETSSMTSELSVNLTAAELSDIEAFRVLQYNIINDFSNFDPLTTMSADLETALIKFGLEKFIVKEA